MSFAFSAGHNNAVRHPGHRTTAPSSSILRLRSPLLSPTHHIITISGSNNPTSPTQASYFSSVYEGATRTPLCSPSDGSGDPRGLIEGFQRSLAGLGLGVGGFGAFGGFERLGSGLGISKSSSSDGETSTGNDVGPTAGGGTHEFSSSEESSQEYTNKNSRKSKPVLRISDMPPVVLLAPPPSVALGERSGSNDSVGSDGTVTGRLDDAGMTPGRKVGTMSWDEAEATSRSGTPYPGERENWMEASD
ncbi:hypothetical protein P7C70_g144, partial [Phenoliferia sp. Uapishka_3]